VVTDSQKINFLKKVFGFTKVSRDGSNVAVKCPACKEKKGKFSINVSNWMCHCWICGVKSRNIYFILKKHISINVASSFAKEFGLPKDARKHSEPDQAEEEEVKIPDGFILLSEYLEKDPDIRDVIGYCMRRGLTRRDMRFFRVGTAKNLEFRRRVIIPSFDNMGNVNYFVSRTIDPKGYPKYANSKARKMEIIFNEMNINWKKELVLVEGPFDLFKSSENSTCLLGSKLPVSCKLFRKIVENKTPVVLALDEDMQRESCKIATLLSSYGCQVKIFPPIPGRDIGDMSKKEFKEKMNQLRQWESDSTLRFKIQSLKSGSIL